MLSRRAGQLVLLVVLSLEVAQKIFDLVLALHGSEALFELCLAQAVAIRACLSGEKRMLCTAGSGCLVDAAAHAGHGGRRAGRLQV